ncbi:hypothetical protein DMH17_03160 [Raoultella planticola]|nr:hypothetical protein [Raoultella planticola]
MTPQLQQAIRLLQLSTLELQARTPAGAGNNPPLEQTDLHEEVKPKRSRTANRWTPSTLLNKRYAGRAAARRQLG